MTAKKQPTHHSSDLPWYKQTHFLVAMVIIALLVGFNSRPMDSNASLAPSPTIETPAPVLDTPAPAPVVEERVVYVQQPAPAPITNNNIIMVGADEPGTVLKEIPAVMQKPMMPNPVPEPSPPERKTARSKHCEQMLAEHNRRVEEMKATLRSYRP